MSPGEAERAEVRILMHKMHEGERRRLRGAVAREVHAQAWGPSCTCCADTAPRITLLVRTHLS